MLPLLMPERLFVPLPKCQCGVDLVKDTLVMDILVTDILAFHLQSGMV